MGELAYEEVALEALTWSAPLRAFTYECPCGDLFQISGDELAAGEDVARCPSCTLVVRVLLPGGDVAAFAAAWAADGRNPAAGAAGAEEEAPG